MAATLKAPRGVNLGALLARSGRALLDRCA
jgi:hypothetical protein